MTEPREILGRPVTGDYTPGGRAPVVQAPDSEFIEYLDELFANPEVIEVRWDQYTPYFNDGDPCEFTVHDPYVKVTWEDAAEAGEYGDEFLGDYDLRDGWGDSTKYVFNGHDTTELHATLMRFAKALNGPHDVMLRKIFGDHAQVTATREGFDVEFYEHD